MSIISSIILAGLASATVIPHTSPAQPLLRKRDDGDCADGGPWIAVTYGGGYADGDTDFCETGYPSYGHPISQINTFCGAQAVRGVNFNYDDPNQAQSIPQGTQTYGQSSGDGISGQTLNINYAGGELISSVTMYAPDGAKVLRGLTITTNQGQTLQCGVDSTSGFNAITQDVGTGVLIGVSGDYQAAVIDNLGFMFLDSPVAQIVVQDIQITGGPTGTQGIAPTSLAQQHFYDGGSSNQTWTFSGNKQVMSSTTITQSIVTTYSAQESLKVSFSGSFLSIIKGDIDTTTNFMWSQATTETNTLVTTTSETLTWMESGQIAPGYGITCNSISGMGSGNFPYTAMVSIILADGTTYVTYKDYGSLYVQAVSSNSVSCVGTTGS